MLIIAAGVAVRLLLAVLFDNQGALWLGDTPSYVSEAQALQHGILPDFARGVGYPVFLALTLWLGASGVRLIQMVLSVGTGIATFYLLGRGRTAFSTGLGYAGMPFLALFDFRLLSESLTVNLLWLGFLLLYNHRWLGAGVLIGLALLTRDTLLLLPLAVLPFLDRRMWKASALAVAITLASLPLPSGESRLGLNLWVGAWERNTQWYQRGLSTPDFPEYAFALPGERQAVEQAWGRDDDVLRDLAVQRLTERPIETLRAWIERYPKLWLGTRTEVTQMRAERGSVLWTLLKSSFYALNLAVLGLGLWGLVKYRGLFAVPPIYAALIYTPFHNAETRYSLMALPFLLLFAVKLVSDKLGRSSPTA